MAERIPIAIDTLGGDNGPVYFVRGAIEGLKQNKNVKLFLVGNAEELESLLAEYEDYDKDRIEIVPSTEVIGCDEPPVEAIRKKKDSSLAVGLRLVKEGKAKALISAGSRFFDWRNAVSIRKPIVMDAMASGRRPWNSIRSSCNRSLHALRTSCACARRDETNAAVLSSVWR